MDHVENTDYADHVIVGIGTKAQEGALLTAGAEKVFDWPGSRDGLLRTAGSSIRKQDTLLMVQPTLMKIDDLRAIVAACAGDLFLQVVGHGPSQDLDLFRKQKPKGADAVIEATTGRPAKITYTIPQAEAIIRLWHDVPKRKPSDIAKLADAILGLDEGTVKTYWVRDLVIKFVGTAKREKPDGWRGIPTGSEREPKA